MSLYADVILNFSTRSIDTSFEYLIPEQFKKEIKVGLGVLVPFQNGLKVGYITSIKNSSTFKNHKNILQIIEEKPFFGKDSIKLARWISDYYLSGIGDAIRLFLPPGGSQKIIKIIYFNKIDESDLDLKEDEKEIIKMVKSETNGISIDKLKDKGKILERLLKRKVLGYLYKMQAPNIKPLKERFIKLKKTEGIEEFIKKSKSKKKKSILKMLLIRECMKWKDIKDETNCTLNQIRDLEKEGFVEVFLEVRYSEINTDFPEIDKKVELTEEQTGAFEKIKGSIEKVEPKVYLVQGVTGSGKTELYLNAINEVLKKGKMTIMLVPEISLTPQLVNRFNQRFKHLVALIHSGLSSRERYDQWKAVHEGKYKIVIGTRSALFAPVKNLGLIILDEEHENSYKQNKEPRYHARETAIKLGEITNSVVVLGSATPSLESKYRSLGGEIDLLNLTKRVGKSKMPDVKIIDLKKERNMKYKVLSKELVEKLEVHLQKEKKAIIFLNRRGFFSFILCKDCGKTITCPHCHVSLVYHKDKNCLLCHHCSYSRDMLKVCPYCHSFYIGFFGVGTQRVEEELKSHFPDVKVIRMDRDTSKNYKDHKKKLTDFVKSKKAILLGTQMVAKGHDFPEVAFVGVVNADTSLHLPDFRASERTFQTLMQVGGRAGRDHDIGEVVIQSYLPESSSLSLVKENDYDSFFQEELKERESLKYPPYAKMINIIISGKDGSKVEKSAEEINKKLSELQSNCVEVLGPAPCPIPKIKGYIRWHLTIKIKLGENIGYKQELKKSLKKYLSLKDIKVIIDVDPVTTL